MLPILFNQLELLDQHSKWLK